MANAARNELDVDVVVSEIAETYVVADLEVLVQLRQNCCFHRGSSLFSGGNGGSKA